MRALYNDERIGAIPAGNYRGGFPWAHVLVGFCVIILIGYQSTNRRFSESLKRSLLRSYNFFVDLRDLHAVSILHTLILALAISVTLATLVSSVIYHYRTDRLADDIATFLFVTDAVKLQFIRACWHPLAGIAGLSALFFVLGALLGIFIKFLAFFIRARVSGLHAYSVSVWSAAPVVFLSPVAMSLFKITENPAYVVPLLAVILVFLCWTFFRVLKGISVVYDLSPAKTYTAGILLWVLFWGGTYLYYDSIYAVSAYLKFIAHLSQNLG